MSGWEEAGAKKKKKAGSSQQKKEKKEPPKVKREPAVQGTMFHIFNDVEADKQKKKEAAEKRAAKARKNEKFTGAFEGEELTDPRTNFEKKMKAKMESQKKKSAAKKKASAQPADGGSAGAKPVLSIAQVVAAWDTPALVAKLAEIDDKYDPDTQEHVMVLMIAEYLEEQFSGATVDWGELLELPQEESIEQPVEQLPNKSCEAIVKKLRQRSPEARLGLAAFLISHTWQTLSGKKAGGIGVRMLLQLVARVDAGAIAGNVRMLPIPGMEKVRGPEVDPDAPATKQGKHPTIKPEDAKHPLSTAQTVWVLRQLGSNAHTARTRVFDGWCSYILPLLSPQSSPAATAELAYAVSREIFSKGVWEKLALRPEERKPDKGAGIAQWMISPASLKELLCLRLPQDRSEPFRRVVLQICAKHGHATGLFGPALFAQLLPLLGTLQASIVTTEEKENTSYYRSTIVSMSQVIPPRHSSLRVRRPKLLRCCSSVSVRAGRRGQTGCRRTRRPKP